MSPHGTNEESAGAALRDARLKLQRIVLDEPSAPRRAALEPVLEALMRAESALIDDNNNNNNPRAGARAHQADAGPSAEPPDSARRRVSELEEALRARDEFIATIAHELKNPVTPVLLQVRQLLTTAIESPGGSIPREALVPRLESILGRLRRFIDTLNRILDVSRVSSGRIELALDDVDLAEVVRGVAADMEREVAASKSALTVHAGEPVIGRWDRLRLEQITGNLLSNAIRYGLGAPIDVRVMVRGGEAILEVRDRGIGIPEEEQELIFDRFERGAGPRQVGGFGVGLWIVKKLCVALGGRIDVQSRPSQGSTFTVTLPREERKTT